MRDYCRAIDDFTFASTTLNVNNAAHYRVHPRTFTELSNTRQSQLFQSLCNQRKYAMTLCPIALVTGCKKCPAFSVCPLKGVIGDHQKPVEADTKKTSDEQDKES